MELTDLQGRLELAGMAVERQLAIVLDALSVDAPADWRQLAAALAVREGQQRETVGRTGCHVFGISGGQGAGKSTLAALMVDAAACLGLRTVALSLDDFYLTRSERVNLAERVHPLLATRGVPGTHDLQLAGSVIDTLSAGGDCEVPVFDKAQDDRQAHGRLIQGPVDLLIFEGWCVGVTSQPEIALAPPVNALEAEQDPHGHWRRYVNDRLVSAYPALWGRLHSLLYLKVPDIAAVIRWRTQQEEAHPVEQRMSAAAIARFVAHYERLTLWMGESLPQTAELVGLLDEKHRLEDLLVRHP